MQCYLPFEYLLDTHGHALLWEDRIQAKDIDPELKEPSIYSGLKDNSCIFLKAPYVYERLYAGDLWLGIQEPWVLFFLHCECALNFTFLCFSSLLCERRR